jgi:acetyl esterase/lipase
MLDEPSSEDAAARVAREQEAFELYPVNQSVSVIRNVIYGNTLHRNLLLDLYTPILTPLYLRPAIIFLHGGCWRFGNKNQFCRQASYLAKKYNFFAVSIDYRLSEEARFPAALHDSKCAVRWVRSVANLFNIDSDKVAMAGGSAGAHLTAMVAATANVPEYEGDGGHSEYKSNINLAILYNGEFDLWDLVKKGSLIEDMRIFLGFTSEENPSLYDRVSPIRLVNQAMPPTLLLHGDQDLCVSYKQSISMHKALLEKGIHSELKIYEGKPHAWFNFDPDYKKALQRMAIFLKEQFNL